MTRDKFVRFTFAIAALLGVAGCQSTSKDQLHMSLVKTDTERSQELYLSVIEQLIENGKAHAAMAHLDEYDRLNGPSPRSRKLRADAWFAMGDLDQAEKGYQSITEARNSGFGQHGLGRVAAARGNWELASTYFEQAVRAQPTNAHFLNDFGCALYRTERYDQAEFELRKALELSPLDAEVTNNILVLLAKSGRTDRFSTIFADMTDTAAREILRSKMASYARGADKADTP